MFRHFHKVAPFYIVDISIPFPCLPQPSPPKINVVLWTLKSFSYFRQHWFRRRGYLRRLKGYGVGARAVSICVELFECPPLGFEGSLKSQICKKFLHRHELQRIGNQPNLPLVKFSFPKALKTTTTTTTTNKQKYCHATLISLSLPAEATQFFSSGCQSIANAGPLCPTCWMKGELVWRLSHNYNKKDGKNASQVSRNLVPRGFSLFNMTSEEKLVTWFGCVTGSSLLPPL